MYKILFATVAILVVASFAMAQTQGTAIMSGAKHDLRPTSGKPTADTISGASVAMCAYCHTPHVPQTGIAVPLWARKAKADQEWGRYTSTHMDATTVDPSLSTGNQHKNESNMCLSCHDGSAMYTSAAYEKRPFVATGWPAHVEQRRVQNVRDRNRIIGGTTYSDLSHVHPVNFTYADAVAGDLGLWPAQTARYVHLDGTTQVGRLFNGKVQCSSCHNPHRTDTKMIQGTTADGKLCVACHKK